ncbi:MAG: ABC transporter substrate-binding protein [Bdellovibrionota bacterium]
MQLRKQASGRFLPLLLVALAAAVFLPPGALAQKFTVVHTGASYTPKGKPYLIRATIQPRSNLSYATVFYRRAGNTSYASVFMADKGGDSFEVELPAEAITKNGLEYYISAIDKSGNETLLFASPTEPHFVSTKIVAVMLSRRGEKYEEVLTGLKTALKARVDNYDMNDSEAQGKAILKQLRQSAEQPDLLVAVGKSAAILSKSDVKEIPVVFTMVSNPYKEELKRENMTGVSLDVPVKVQLLTFKSVVPGIKRLGVIYNPEKTGDLIGQASFIAPSQGFQLITAKIESPEEVTQKLSAFSEGIDAFWLVPDATVVTPLSVKAILEYTFTNKIPLFVFEKTFVDAGALVSISPDLQDIGRITAEMANKVLRGTDPATLTIINPDKLKVALNNETARSIGVGDTVAKQVILYAAEKGFPIETVGRR